VADLFAELRASHNQIAVVFDEYGGTAGIVTLEELLEEIVGRVSDELIVGEGSVVRLDEMTVEIDPLLRIDEVNEQLGLDLPEGDEYETVAGLVLYRLQHIPAAGEVLHCRNLEIKITEMKGPKIERVQVRRTP
jgi:CBS domain containing-hemolysin-like protein